MKLFEYQNKLPESGNLQDAYKQIETIEAQAKLTLEMLTGICFDEHTEINNVNDFRWPPKRGVLKGAPFFISLLAFISGQG